MSANIVSAQIMIPVTAKTFDSHTIEVQNLFMFPEKKQRLLTMCASTGVEPVDVTADTIIFKRSNKDAVVALLKHIQLRPIITPEAEVSGIEPIAVAFETNNSYNGYVDVNLYTAEGTVRTGIAIEVLNLDETDAVKLLGTVREAVASFNKPINVTHYTNESILVPNQAQTQELHASLAAAFGREPYFEKYMIYLDNIPLPKSVEARNSYASAVSLQYPDGKTVKIPLAETTPRAITNGDVFVGPHPKFLPVRASTVTYKVVDTSPNMVSFTVEHNGKDTSSSPYKMTRSQFESLIDFYQAEKKQVNARNFIHRKATEDQKTQSDRDQKKFMDFPKTKAGKEKKAPVISEGLAPVPAGDNVSKNTASNPPKGTTITPISASYKITKALGIW